VRTQRKRQPKTERLPHWTSKEEIRNYFSEKRRALIERHKTTLREVEIAEGIEMEKYDYEKKMS
jgi:hypothetical protein